MDYHGGEGGARVAGWGCTGARSGSHPPADGVSEHVWPAEAGGVDEPEIEAREIVDAFHPRRVARPSESGMGGGPHGEALGHLLDPPRPSAIAAGTVEDHQRLALAAGPRVDVDTADRDRLLTGSHAPYYAPGVSASQAQPADRRPMAEVGAALSRL